MGTPIENKRKLPRLSGWYPLSGTFDNENREKDGQVELQVFRSIII